MGRKRTVQYIKNSKGEMAEIDLTNVPEEKRQEHIQETLDNLNNQLILVEPCQDTKTDLERFIELYRSFGIECKVFKNYAGEYQITLSRLKENSVTYSDKFLGMYDCYSAIIFDTEGKFLRQGFYGD